MLFYSLPEILLIAAAAIVMDWIIGDPKWPTHPVIWIGRFIGMLEKRLRSEGAAKSAKELRRLGVILTVTTVLLSFAVLYVDKRSGCTYSPMAGLCGICLVYLDNYSCKRA